MKYIGFFKKYNGMEELYFVALKSYSSKEGIAKYLKEMNDKRGKSERSRREGFRFVTRVIDSETDEFKKYHRSGVISGINTDRYLSKEGKAWLKAVVAKYPDIPTDHLESLIHRTIKYDIRAEEYISVSCRASIWTTYAYASEDVDGTNYQVRATIDSDARAL